MLFSDLQKIVDGRITIVEDLKIRRFATDTRTLSGTPDEVFVAAKGKRDGHDFIQSAGLKGVRNFIVENAEPAEGYNFIQVADSIEAFQKIASHHRLSFDIPVVGITGSNGKTTVKEWLSLLLSEKYFVVKNPKSYNSQVGVPISIMDIQPNHEIGVFEAGISQVGEMAKLEKMIKPTLGLFTTLGHAHSEGFTSDQQKLSEKLELFREASKVIHRSDQPYSAQISSELNGKSFTWSLDDSGHCRVRWKEGELIIDQAKFDTNFIQEAHLENVTHAIVAALYLDVPHHQIQKGLQLLSAIPMRLELKKGINGCYLLDDSYNNDLAGLKVALDYLKANQQNERKTLILSDILQSGIQDNILYSMVNEFLVERKIDRLIGVGRRIKDNHAVFEIPAEFFETTEDLLDRLPSFDGEMIVIKGAREFRLERVSRQLEERIHGTVLEVNFEALQHNLNQFRNLLSPSTKMMVMVKANAYGSGILEVANFLQHQKVNQLGVAYVDEAIQLRKNGIQLPIMIMNPLIESFVEFERYDLQAEIFNLSHLKRLLKDTRKAPSIQIKIDTGMHRLGFSLQELPALIQVLKANPQLKIEGIFTHFSSADAAEEDAFTIQQAEIFEEAYHRLTEVLGYAPIKHACNSPAMVRWPQYHFDMVRLGIGLHGFDPTHTLKLRPSGKLKTVISQIQPLRKGETVGYSRKGYLLRDSKIAVLPIGYEDGYLRFFGNGKASVLIHDVLCPTVGNICMDMMMVDVTDIDAKEGDEVTIFGEKPTIHDLASWSQTIPYEILTNVSSRVKRVFVWE